MAPDIYALAEQFQTATQPAFYFYAGSKESPEMVPNMQKLSAILQKKNRYIIRSVVNPLGQHQEAYWKQEVRDFLKWWNF